MKRDVLIQCGDHEENVERILPLALYCREAGYNPIALIYEKNDGLKFLEEGIDTYRLALKESDSWYRKSRRAIVVRTLDEASTYRGCAISDVFGVDSLNGYRLTKGRKNSLVRHIDRLVDILDDVDPGMLLIWNGYTGRVANVLRVLSASRHIPAMYMERGLMRASVFLDPLGVNGFSALHQLNTVPRMREPIQLPESSTPASVLTEVVALIPLEQRQKKCIFVPLQVERDTNILIHSNGIVSMSSFVETILSRLTAEFFVVIRPHPEEVDKIEIDMSRHSHAIMTTRGTLDAWLEHCDAVVTINSTVGLQALLKQRPVFSFGKSIYSGKGLDIPVTGETLRAKVEGYFTEPSLDIEAIQAFYSYLLSYHTCHDEQGCGVLQEHCGDVTVRTEASRFFNHWELSPQSHRQYVEALERSLRGRRVSTVIVIVTLDDIYLDLTYRKTKVEITRAFLEEELLSFLHRLDISFGDIIITKRSKSLPNALNILVTDHLEPNREVFDLVVDPFFKLRPSHSTSSTDS